MNLLTHFRKITILRFALGGLVLLFLVPALFADGIASRYPNDVGIQNDPDVLLYDGFESYSHPEELRHASGGPWDGAGPLPNLRIATETGHFFAGRKALEMKLPIANHEQVDAVLKSFEIRPEPVLYIRAYEKWDRGFTAVNGHNGIRMSGDYPGPGNPPPPDGSGFFLFTLQNAAFRAGAGYPGYNEIYAYWPLQRSGFGDHWYPDGWVIPGSPTCGNQGEWLCHPAQYPNFVALPIWQPSRNVWYCFEVMVRVNTLGQHNGEVAYWVNGQLKGRFTNLFIRSRDSLKIDTAELNLHALTNPTRVQRKWYDSVVIARSYIGPISHP